MLIHILQRRPEICEGKVVVVQYLVRWAGWAVEYDTWEFSKCKDSSITAELLKYYEAGSGMMIDLDDMVFEGDLYV